ncbi:MAG: AI-2E family transporter [Bacilli bacterium]|nr:AI-2E family transporter [Bacilli bacterium]
MFNKIKKTDEKLDTVKLNELISVSRNLLKIIYVLIIIIGIYLLIRLLKELNAKEIIITILKTISPLFIGIFVAWLFDPFVKYLKKKGIKRSIGTLITYLILITFIAVVVGSIIPVLSEQINELVKILPDVFDNLKTWLDNLFDKLNNINNLDVASIKSETFSQLEHIVTNLTSSLPTIVVDIAKSLFSGIGTLLIGLIIGFYLLMSFDNANDAIITLLPKKYQKDTRELSNEVNTSLRRFIKGALIDASLIFVVTSIGFILVGLRAPLLFGLFCAITNIIPYAGPYIGGIPAVIVGFSAGPVTGFLTLIVIVVVQVLEGNFLQPFIMSKTTKLHPVTIIIGLLVFGYFFGIIGMAVATPVIAAFKTIFVFFNEKYSWITYND